jgi:hypothetical protein
MERKYQTEQITEISNYMHMMKLLSFMVLILHLYLQVITFQRDYSTFISPPVAMVPFASNQKMSKYCSK